MLHIIRFTEKGRIEYLYDPECKEDGECWSENANIAFQFSTHKKASEYFQSRNYSSPTHHIMNAPGNGYPISDLQSGQLVQVYKDPIKRKKKEGKAILSRRVETTGFSETWEVNFLENGRS